MSKNIHKEGSDKEHHHDKSTEGHHRVAPRLKAVVKNKGTHEEKKKPKK